MKKWSSMRMAASPWLRSKNMLLGRRRRGMASEDLCHHTPEDRSVEVPAACGGRDRATSIGSVVSIGSIGSAGNDGDNATSSGADAERIHAAWSCCKRARCCLCVLMLLMLLVLLSVAIQIPFLGCDPFYTSPDGKGQELASCDVISRSGVCDGRVDDTSRLQAALVGCAAQQRRVVLHTGCRCSSLPLWLPPNSSLMLSQDALLQAAPKFKWPCRLPGISELVRTGALQKMPALISATDVWNITLAGSGTIDGRGSDWWPRLTFGVELLARPRLLQFENVTDVLIAGLTFTNPAHWTASFGGRRYTIRDVVIRSPGWGQARNTDGIDIAATDVHVDRADISNGDDSICIKSPSANVLVENSVVRQGNGLVIGTVWSGLSRDDQWVASVHNVTFRNCTALDTVFGCHIKYYPPQRGLVSNVLFENIFILQTAEARQRRINVGGTGQAMLSAFTCKIKAAAAGGSNGSN